MGRHPTRLNLSAQENAELSYHLKTTSDSRAVEIAGRDRSAVEQRKLFAEAIGYQGEDVLSFLGQIGARIRQRSGGKLKPVNRLKPSKKSGAGIPLRLIPLSHKAPPCVLQNP